ncbi:MAG: protein phosphatase 2C domain-containing protein [Gammaproteobacteria bacterium]
MPPPPDPTALPRLYTSMSMPRIELLRGTAASVAVYTRRSPERDDDNQDALLVLEHGDGTLVAAVADGAGGYPDGGAASARALEALACACRAGAELPARAAILNGFEAAHAAIKAQGGGAATTLAVIELNGATLRTYHAGDSGIVVCGQRGRLRLQSVSHSPTGYAVEAGLLDAAEALHHEDRHMVSNLLGLEPMSVEIGSPIEMAVHDTALIASDGLYDNLYLAEIIEIMRKGPLDEACAALAERARSRMLEIAPGAPCKPDDLGLVLVRRARA